MKNILIILLFAFTVVNIKDSTIMVSVPSEYTSGTDTACENYIQEVKNLLRIYKQVRVVNSGWVPSSKIINRGDI